MPAQEPRLKTSAPALRLVRQREQFIDGNPKQALPQRAVFGVIFLQTVMVYFNDDTKGRIEARMRMLLKPVRWYRLLEKPR